MSAGSTTCTCSPTRPGPGTPAAKMPQVARDVIKARAATPAREGRGAAGAAAGPACRRTAMALVEKAAIARGFPDFSPVRIEGVSPEAGRPALFRLVSRTASELVGVPA